MGSSKFQVVALFRIGDAAAREEGAADKGRAAEFLLQHAEVDVVGEGAADFRAEGVKDLRKLFRIGDGKALFAGCALWRELIKGQRKRAL